MSDWRELPPIAPARVPEARPGGLYGMALALGVLGVIGAVLLYSYAHLAANADAWPPPGTSRPSSWTLLAAGVLAPAAAMATTRAYHYAHADERDRVHVMGALVAATVLSTAALTSMGVWLAGIDGASDHSFGAVVLVLGAYVAVALGVGVGGGLLVGAWVALGHAGTAPADSVRILRALHWFTAAAGVVVLPLLALGGGG